MEASLKIHSARTTYDVELGDFTRWRDHLPAGRRLIIADQRVLDLHPRVVAALRDEVVLPVEATEGNKTLDYATGTVLPFLLENGASRATTIVAVGGGIVQDLVGFVCSITFRGLKWWFYPSTLLAQADSCIGSKTSINHLRFKNLLGTFFPPQRVVLDTGFIATLTDLDFQSGIGEIVKIHFVEGTEAARELASDIGPLWDRVPDAVSRCVVRSLQYKKRFIELDEYDEGPRLVLNYGHCFGHALEAATDYVIPHGIAIMYGMAVANRLSARRGYLPAEVCHAMNEIIEPRLPLVDVALGATFNNIEAALKRDKKNLDGKLVFIVTEGYGQMRRALDVDPRDIREVWEHLLAEAVSMRGVA